MVIKQLKMEGFLLSSFTHKHRFPSALKQLAQWLVEVKNQELLLLLKMSQNMPSLLGAMA